MAQVDRIPLSSRPLDKIWFLWFVPLTALIDGQAIYPKHLVPPLFRQLYLQALHFSKDALMLGMERGDPSLFWFRGFLCLEVFFQLPLFFIGAWCLYYNIKSIYPLLLIYSASCCTTLIPCLMHIISPPPTLPRSTPFQMAFGLGTYIPFFLVPFGMMVDMASRLGKAVEEQEKRGSGKKRA